MSDHISGPRALAEAIADITDMCAFPSPEQPDRLVLVMNTLPMAKPTDLFSEGLLYRFKADAAGNVQPDVPPWNRMGYGNNAIEVLFVDRH